MRASVLQLKQLVFQRISVEDAKPLDSVVSGEAVDFDFDGVNFRLIHEVGTINVDGKEDPRGFIVTLGIGVDNTEGKPSPYKIDILATGIVEISEKITPDKRTNLVAVYGAIRELVTTLTSRCIPGPMILPTMDFRDSIEQSTQDATTKSPD